MQDILNESLKKLKKKRVRRTRMVAILLVLSLVVSLDVFWSLRQPGLTLAGNADCGITEHSHNELCKNGESSCQIVEHIHTIDCYSDETADVESQLDWQKMFEDYPFTGNLGKDLVGIAKTQVGYSESKLNFQVDQSGVRHGYTRYGEWYGTPYSNWSAIFVSFCLHYAGADNDQFPSNSGANAMAAQWKTLGKYKSANSYQPIVGDLIFFKDNTVGIVSDLLNSSFYVIRGDVDGSVCGELIQLADSSIDGFGTISNSLSLEELLDISNGPAVFVFDGESGTTVTSTIRTYNLRTTKNGNDEINDLITYLNTKGGSYSFTLLDAYNHAVPKDENGNLIVHANTLYKITLTTHSSKGFAPGTYTYQLPEGITIEGHENEFKGDFILTDKTNVGSWSINKNGLLSIVFNDNMNTRTDVTISATIGVSFPEQDEPIDFDGKIMVTIEPPREEIAVTEVQKWGIQGNEANVNNPSMATKTDESKLYWTVLIEGNADSNIPGSTIKDNIIQYDWSYEHTYTQSDMDAGIRFGASVVNPNDTTETFWHQWTVYPGDENLTWTEKGWSYTMPETIWCTMGHEAVLGNEYWSYYIEYTSTPTHTDVAGELSYTNSIETDNQKQEGWGGFTQTEINAAIFKNGTIVTDANGANIIWEIKATIPGKKENIDYEWYVLDSMNLIDSNGSRVEYIYNDLDVASVTANFYGQTINVPFITDATEDDPYAYQLYTWPEDQGTNQIQNVRQILFLSRCNCDKNPCGNPCWKEVYWKDGREILTDYCRCWLETEDTTFTITYKTDITDEIAQYSGLGYYMRNRVGLGKSGYNGEYINTDIPIPSVVEKKGTEFKDLIAKYTITVNESKLNLTDGTPLLIHDEMTETLAFIRGTLVVKSVDAAGNEVYLQENVDYTYTYDGTGEKVVNGQKVHVLEIEILHPQPVTYFLDYDTTLIIPPGTKDSVTYNNSATVTLWNKKVTDISTERVYPDINIASSYYAVILHKITATDRKNLPGAKFGVFNEHGGLIIETYTDSEGKILFETNVEEGIILREHELYYVQEIEAPSGYKLDDAKHWFCFCSSSGENCNLYQDLVAGKDLVRIPFNSVGHIDLTNELLSYNLPATGSVGVYPILLSSALFIIAPFVYIFIRKRKREGKATDNFPYSASTKRRKKNIKKGRKKL
ncbi:MAG: hypothetical protein E7542_03600 [Ruminococcaceae bacterium]|nr:hypothetical protein [Oscillospiraceae bacterium]